MLLIDKLCQFTFFSLL